MQTTLQPFRPHRLFEKLCDEDESTVVMSPLVIAGVLALTAAGATPGGKTEAQLLGALGVQTAADHTTLAARVLAAETACSLVRASSPRS